ncbi:MAG: hydroxymethylglutaryl-CoA reductase [Thermoanaerobaculia bacterium]|nr:hydroxymethylglutaryl-CoA reductase [Thermoanaerobaculia bacterium]
MTDAIDSPPTTEMPVRRALALVPRLTDQGYSDALIAERRRWVEERTSTSLPHVGTYSLPGESLRGNIENPIGCCQIPVGVVGPIEVHGEHAEGRFYVPMATTEGALARSYERGMVAITKSGGATCRVLADENCLCPTFECDDLAAATVLARSIPALLPQLQAIANATTGHGRLQRVTAEPLGRRVHFRFGWTTGDAHGMNMIVKGTEAVCQWLVQNTVAKRYLLFSAASGEKRPAGVLLQGGKGKSVVAGALIPAAVLRSVLHVTAAEMLELWQQTVVGHLRSASLGYNGHIANGLTALFIACGQDVANVVNSAIGISTLEVVGDDLYASVHLPSLTIGTVGGGTNLATARECLSMIGCVGSGKVGKFAEITAAMMLAGELSIAAAIASGEFVAAHEAYGRNRPED